MRGYSFTRDPNTGFFSRKEEPRTKILSIASGNLIVYELPAELDVEDVRVEQPGGHTVIATDGQKFQMDLSERL